MSKAKTTKVVALGVDLSKVQCKELSESWRSTIRKLDHQASAMQEQFQRRDMQSLKEAQKMLLG